MAFGQRVKKQFLTDAIVIILIIIVLGAVFGVASRNFPGWDIKNSSEELNGQEKEVDSNIFIREQGKLLAEDSTIRMNLSYDGEFGIYISGDSELKLRNSRIESDEYQYFIVADAAEEKSPTFEITDSSIADHAGIRLNSRTKFKAESSDVGELLIRDDVDVQLSDSTVYPVLFSERPERYTELSAGDSLDLEIESESGWVLAMQDCEVEGYQLDLFEEDEVKIDSSEDISFGLHFPGTMEDTLKLDLSYVGKISSGSITNAGFDLEWSDVGIESLSLYVEGGDSVLAQKGLLREIGVSGSGELEALKSDLLCDLCIVGDDGKLVLTEVSVIDEIDNIPTLLIQGTASVEIEKSDIQDLRVIMTGGGSLTIRDSEFTRNLIDNRGYGELTIQDDE